MLAVELIFFTFSLACIVYFYEHPGLHWNLDLLFAALGITVLAAAESALALAITSRMHKQTRSIKIKKFF
jgi:NADH:ubiquinone oxidoreductase subunit K